MRLPSRLIVSSLALLIAIPNIANSQQTEAKPNPVLMARVNGVNDASAASKALKISNMEAKVVVRGMIAETTLTINFSNPSNQTLEGEFTLDMPLGSVVNGYALDINGTMVDGVLVPPHQAQVAYEQRVERRVDPGIVEVSHGSKFSTRVFPIFPGRGRTIRLSFVTPLDPETGYQLPFGSSVSADSFSLSITSPGSTNAPTVQLPRGVSGKWSDSGLSWSGKNVQLGGTLGIKPQAPAKVTVSEHRGEGKFFEIIDKNDAKAASTNASGQVTILWDRSRSRKDQDLAREIAFLGRYIETVKPKAITLVRFDSGGTDTQSVSDFSTLKAALQNTKYAGATSFGGLTNAVPANSDSCLLFSDGLGTLGARSGFDPKCKMFSVTSTRDADRAFLGSRARRSGGDLIDLAVQSDAEALARMTQSAPKIVKVTDAQGNTLETALLDGGPNGWRLVGEAPAGGEVVVTLAGLGTGLTERRYTLPAFASQFNGPGALWAADAIGSNSADRNTANLLRLARRYSVASPIASFIVLETPQDYAQAEIEPPQSYDKNLRRVYDSLKQQADAQMAARQKSQVTTVMAQLKERRDWWTKPVIAVPKVTPQQPRRLSTQNEPMPVAVDAMPPPPPPPPVSAPAPSPAAREERAAESIVVTGAAAGGASPSRRNQSNRNRVDADYASSSALAKAKDGPGGTIAVEQWQSDRPYITVLETVGEKAFETSFPKLEEKYGALPAFYLDISSWLESKGRKAEAARMVMSALDLPTKNNDTLQVVAARLTKLGDLDNAIWLLDQLVELEPERPQPMRTLALALIQRASTRPATAKADLQRAFDLLARLVNTPWDQRFPGVEQIALNDANAIASRLTAMGGSTKAIDPRLLAMLDSDIRIVVEWNTKATDMDLWIDEPDNERIIYSHKRSAKGGYLSNDFTQGYGPEEYFIRKAMPGTYTIRMNTFATDRLNPNGPTTVTARIYRNFGRPSQSEQLIDFEVLPGANGERKVGVVTIEK